MSRKITSADLPFAVPPGGLILDELDARNIDYSEFARAMGECAPSREELLSGEFVITHEVAEKIEGLLESPAYIWAGIDQDFRAAVAAGKSILNPGRPPAKQSSGKVLLRLPTTLHKRIVAKAKSEGISLNQLLLSYVAEGLGRSESSAG